MHIDIERDINLLSKDQWNALVQANPTRTIFQTYEFNRAAQEVYGNKKGSFILCVKDKDKLLAVFPLMFFQSGNKRILKLIGGDRSDYCDILCPSSQEEILPLIWSFILSRRQEWDLIELSNLPMEGTFTRYIKENKELKNLSHRSSQDEAVCLRFNDNETYTKNVLHKKRIHQYQNRLKKNGPYEILHLTKPSDIEIYIDEFFAQHIERWQKTSSPSLFHDEKNRQFYRHIARELPMGWITLSVLKWKGQTLGFHFGLSYAKRFIWYKPAFNIAFAHHSPGQVLLQEVMEYAKTQGFEEFDFGVGKEAYKNRFGNIIRRNNSFRIYSSRSDYLKYYIPLAIQWRLEKLRDQLKLEKLFTKTV